MTRLRAKGPPIDIEAWSVKQRLYAVTTDNERLRYLVATLDQVVRENAPYTDDMQRQVDEALR